jgi:hypothetical protein
MYITAKEKYRHAYAMYRESHGNAAIAPSKAAQMAWKSYAENIAPYATCNDPLLILTYPKCYHLALEQLGKRRVYNQIHNLIHFSSDYLFSKVSE